MNKPEKLPEAVTAGIERYARQHAKSDDPAARSVDVANLRIEILGSLSWDPLCRCYGFVRAGMYHGVELDGYIHT